MDKSIYTDEYKTLTQLLRATREAAGVTQVELAKRLGQSQSYISKIELGDRRLDIVQLRTLLAAIGVKLVDFVVRYESELDGG